MAGYRALAKNRDFSVLWAGTTISQLGSSVSWLTLPLLGYSITHSTLATSIIGSVQMAGLLVTLLPAGILADRFDRAPLMRCSALVGAGTYAAIVIASMTGTLEIGELYAAAALTGLAAGLFQPAETAAVRAVVAPDELPQALAQQQSRQWIASLLGSPLGGLLYGVSRWLPFAADAVSYIVNWIALKTLRTDLRPPARDQKARWHAQVTDGWRYLFGHPFFRVIGVWAPLANLTINAVLYLAALRLISAGFPAWQIGLSEAIIGILGVLGALAAPTLIARCRTGALTILAAWAFVPLLSLIALWNTPWVVAMAAGTGVFFNPAGNAGVSAYAQRALPDDMIGRFASTMSFTSMSTHPFAPLLAGALLTLLGGAPAVFAMTGVCALVALIPTSSRAIRAVPRPADWPLGPAPGASAQASLSGEG